MADIRRDYGGGIILTSNLSIIQRNIVHGLDCEISEASFLRACDHTSILSAEAFAYEVRELVRFLVPALSLSARALPTDGAPPGLMDFILSRHWHSRFGQQTKIGA